MNNAFYALPTICVLSLRQPIVDTLQRLRAVLYFAKYKHSAPSFLSKSMTDDPRSMNTPDYTGNFLPRKKRKKCHSCARLTFFANLNLIGKLSFCDACLFKTLEAAAPPLPSACERCERQVYAVFALSADAPALCRECLHTIATLTQKLTVRTAEEVTL